MKIGVIVSTVFRNILESGNVPKDEIERMQDKEYSKETFGIRYPVLQKKMNQIKINQKDIMLELLKFQMSITLFVQNGMKPL